MTDTKTQRLRIAIFSRYSIAEHYDLAAEFEPMLKLLSSDCDILHLNLKSPKPRAQVPPNVTVHEYPLTVNRRSSKDILLKSILLYLFLPLAAARIRKFKPDAVFVSEVLPLCGLFLKVFCRANTAIPCGDQHLYNLIGKHWWATPLVGFERFIERMELSRMDAVFMRTRSIMKRLAGYGVREERVRIVNDAVDTTAFYPRDMSALRSRCGFKPEDVVLLYHGVMHQGKGLDMLLKWFSELRTDIPGLALIMVGDGSEARNLRDLAKELALGDRVLFTGWVKTIKDVGDYCCAADICIPMRTGDQANMDMIPGALIHSMACRKVCVAPRLPGFCEVIEHGRNGFMFEPDNGEDFKKLIKELVAKRSNWEQVAQTASEDAVERYSIEVSARKYADMLRFFATLPK